ncbi:Phosphoglycerate mutase-like protein AT74 [Arabidopsis thaliana]
MSPDNKLLPKRIILVRHGESEGNLDTAAYTTTPDHKIQLTDSGLLQAQKAGARLHALISSNPSSPEWRVYFYVSPYDRTRSTLREIGRSFSRRRVIGVREECRIREQDFGNFQVKERMRATKKVRERFGRRCLRSRLHLSFLESLWRDIDMNRLHINPSHELNFVIVSHGLTSRVFLMKWFKWSVEQFEGLNNPGNSEIRVMELGQGGDYSLAIHHTEEELATWGLSPEMIADQKWRANAHKGEWKEDCKWYFGDFFDHMADSDKECETEATEEREEEEEEEEGKRVNLLTSSEYSNEPELYNGQCC